MAFFDIKNINLPETMKDMAEKGSEAVFSVRDALRIMYSLKFIDGIVSPEEPHRRSSCQRLAQKPACNRTQ